MSFMLLGILNSQAAGGGGAAYDLLESETLTSSASSITFSSLSAYATDYKHLQIRAVMQDTSANTGLESIGVQFNGDTSSVYSRHTLKGNGSSVVSDNTTSFGSILIVDASGRESNVFGASVIDILDFSASKNTTIRALTGGNGSTSGGVNLTSGGYFNTAAVTSTTLIARGTAFAIGSRFSLIGVK